MYYVYRINSSFDGFTPKIIENRLVDDHYLIYNWNQYYDQLERNDIVFTYFTGRGVRQGIYLISRISDMLGNKRARGKVITYEKEAPILTRNDLDDEYDRIFTRPRGSVFVIPPISELFFDRILEKEVISDVQILDKVDCENCFERENFDFHGCPIFGREYMINWDQEADISISGYEDVISPFWIHPKQSWWMKTSWKEHMVSRLFYTLKSGYELYVNLFAEGIIIAIETNSRFRNLDFNYIINVPLSPDKKEAGELDRVDEICKILADALKVQYIRNGLVLTHRISRRDYKRRGLNHRFRTDYFRFLSWGARCSLDSKNVLVVDDVITDGKTLATVAKKIHQLFPNANLYAASCGLMAKVRNMTRRAISRRSR